MVAEHSRRLAHRHDDAELAVGVVVGHRARPPQEKIVGTPSEAIVELMLHYCGERRRVDLARHKRLARRESLADGIIEMIVAFLAEMQPEIDQNQRRDHDRRGDSQLAHRHRSILRHREPPAKLGVSAISGACGAQNTWRTRSNSEGRGAIAAGATSGALASTLPPPTACPMPI